MEYITLNNGVSMPLEGFGVFQIADLEECERSVQHALEVGYRLIDTASAYDNEEAVGRAIQNSHIPREELFITTKAYIHEMGYVQTKEAFYRSLEKLGLDYIDLYLIHQPFNDYYGAWRAMEDLYEKGLVRAIGVSNFYPDRLLDLCYNTRLKPMVNQLETHPFYQRREDEAIMDKYQIHHQAWSPFAQGINGIFYHDTIQKIADKYKKTTAQVILRWLVERGISVLPKSVTPSRIEENFDIWSFKLTIEDMTAIQTLDTNHSYILDPYSPQEIERIYNYKATE